MPTRPAGVMHSDPGSMTQRRPQHRRGVMRHRQTEIGLAANPVRDEGHAVPECPRCPARHIRIDVDRTFATGRDEALRGIAAALSHGQSGAELISSDVQQRCTRARIAHRQCMQSNRRRAAVRYMELISDEDASISSIDMRREAAFEPDRGCGRGRRRQSQSTAGQGKHDSHRLVGLAPLAGP